MAKFKKRIRYTSRLAKKERDRNLRMTIIFSLLTAGILAAIVYFGVPLFIMLHLTVLFKVRELRKTGQQYVNNAALAT